MAVTAREAAGAAGAAEAAGVAVGDPGTGRGTGGAAEIAGVAGGASGARLPQVMPTSAASPAKPSARPRSICSDIFFDLCHIERFDLLRCEARARAVEQAAQVACNGRALHASAGQGAIRVRGIELRRRGE